MIRTLLVVFLAAAGHVEAAAWQEGFDAGPGGASPYYREGERTVLETENGMLRAVLPGKRALEGVRVLATGLEGARPTTATARVRGKGEIWLCLLDGPSWLYAPKTIVLTHEWQEIALRRTVRREANSLGVYLLSKNVQPGAVFEIDAVRVEQAPLPSLAEASVPPVRFEAEEAATRPMDVLAHEGAKGVGGASYARCGEFPLPRTSRPVVVRARAFAAAASDRFRLSTRVDGVTQILHEAHTPEFGRWLWLEFPAIVFGETTGTVAVDVLRKERNGQVAALDAIVLASEDRAADSPDSARPALPSQPLVRVGRCAQAPLLDGSSDDGCWSEAIACTGFLRVRSREQAEEDTAVRFCYDDTHLYALFECEESILGVAQQRRHEFRAQEKTRDGKIYGDSSCLLLLDPVGDGKRLHEVGANALGTVLDALCEGPSYWTSRDLGWDSGTRAAARTGDGTWSVELAIPFRALGVAAPAPGDSWQVVPGRIAAARRESSSWAPCGAGFHAPELMGRLVFADRAPGLALRAPRRWQPGGNALVVEATGTAGTFPAGFLAAALFAFDKGSANHWLPVPGTDGTHEFSVPVAQEGSVRLRQGLFDAATLLPVYLRPEIQDAVRSCRATLRLDCAGGYEVYLNGERLATGQDAADATVPLPLAQGANAIAVRTERGAVSARLACPGMAEEPVVWKRTATPDANSVLAGTDDSGWANAEAGAAADGPAILRHTLVWESTRVWPAPKPALHLARGIPQQLIVVFDTHGRQLRDWSLHLAVPPGFRVLGATGYYGRTRPGYPTFATEDRGTTVLDGRAFQLAQIRASAPLRERGHAIFTVCNVLVEATAEARLDGPYSFVYWTRANDGAWSEIPREIAVQVLPELRGKQPKQLLWQLWGSFFGPMDDEAVKESYLRLAQAAGFNDLVAGDRWTSDHGPAYGIRNTKGVLFVSWSIDLKGFLEAHADHRLLAGNGERSDQYMCTTRLLEDEGWAPVHAALAKLIEESGAHTVDYDFEYGPFAGPHSCYCPACLAAFRRFAALPETEELTPETIKTTHRTQWIAFMADRVAHVFRRLRRSVEAVDPDCVFSVYSGYHGEGNAEQYGVDWARVGELRACDRAACGYGRPVERIRGTVAALDGIPLVCGALLNPYDTRLDEPLVPLTVARLLRRSLDATGGVLVYDRLPMDGRCWLAVAETTRLVATYEELFLKGTRAALPEQPEECVVLLSHGDQSLLCLLNPGFQNRAMQVEIPFAAREFYTGRAVGKGQTLEASLAPGDVAVYVKTP